MLYSARSVMDVRHDDRLYGASTVYWFKVDSYTFPAPLDDLFEDVSLANDYGRSYAQELFSEEEIELFRRWLRDAANAPELVVVPVPLPLASNARGYLCRDYSPSYEGFVGLDWELPFGVEGFYSLRYWDAELGDFRFQDAKR